MRTIYKCQLKLVGVQTIQVPCDAVMLNAREQRDRICVWFTCTDDARQEERTIYIVGTGNSLPDEAAQYLGTASLERGQLIFHVFAEEVEVVNEWQGIIGEERNS